MTRDWELTEEQFNRLLNWLDPDREAAGRAYALIQWRLVRFFATRGYIDAENLADRCIDVTVRKVDGLTDYVGDRTLYFLGVARYVLMERIREQHQPIPDPDPPPIPDADREECLERCLTKLAEDDRVLVLEYEEGEKGSRIRKRRQLAEDLNITMNALRIKIHRLHQELHECILSCLNELPAN